MRHSSQSARKDEMSKPPHGQGVRVLQAFLKQPPMLTPEEGRELDRILRKNRLQTLEDTGTAPKDEKGADELPS